MILMHDQQNPLTTSNYILYAPKREREERKSEKNDQLIVVIQLYIRKSVCNLPRERVRERMSERVREKERMGRERK